MCRRYGVSGLSVFVILFCCFGIFVGAASAQVDLTEGGVTVTGTPIGGKTLQVADTVTNLGATAVTNSYTQLFLSSNGTTKGTFLGYRYTGAVPSTATTTVTLPANIAGPYYVMACANGNKAVIESNYDNNCAASAPFVVAGANLTETVSVNVSGVVLSGTTVQVTDTLTNAGVVDANSSYTQIFLTTGTTKTFVGYRYPAAVKAGNSAAPVTTPIVLPANISGSYSVQVCANASKTVVESNYDDNCASAPLDVVSAGSTVIVDPAKVASQYNAATCGTATAACKTIADGIAKATAGQTVLVSPGTYFEQVTIAKNISLVSSVKNMAIIKAPASTKLVPDADGSATLVTVTGGATSVLVKNMTVAGPVFADSCADTMFGIYVKNANAIISGNKIDSIQQSNPYLWGCQPGVGIRFGARNLAYVGHTGTISGNTVIAPAKAGIVVDGDNTNVNVTGNTVTGLKTVGIIGQNGIQMSRGAKGTVDSNTISGFTYGATLAQQSAAGILIYDVTGGVNITNNTVTGNDEGIGVYYDPTYVSPGVPNYAVQFATNVAIKSNTVNNNVFLGIHIDPFSKGNTIWSNIVTGNPAYDVVDEHPDVTYNDWWGTVPANNNTFGTAYVGLVFSY